MQPQACYTITKTTYRLMLGLTGTQDADLVKEQMTSVLTRNHLLALTAARYGFTVQWKPYLRYEIPIGIVGWDVRAGQDQLFSWEPDPGSPFGAAITWVSQDVEEQIRKAKEDERQRDQ